MAEGQCKINTTFEGGFDPEAFQNTVSIRFWHLHSARFGNTNNLTMSISGSQSDGEEYLRGLRATGITIFSLAVLWCLILIGFKCLGPYRVGWLSGKHVPLPPKPVEQAFAKEEEFQEASTSWENQYKELLLSRKIMKGFVVFSGLGIVASAIMLSVKGLDSFIQTLDEADTVINEATRLMLDGVILMDGVIASQYRLVANALAASDAINQMCPEVRESVCTNITDAGSCNFQGIIENTGGLLEFLDLVANTRSYVIDKLYQSQMDLLFLMEKVKHLPDKSEAFSWAYWAFWCSLAFSLATAVMSLFFVFRAIWPPTKSSRCSCRNAFVIPCFVLLVLLSWTSATILVTGSIGVADMCFNSPAENMKALLQRMPRTFSPLIYESFLFYISECPANLFPPQAIDLLKFLAVLFDGAQSAIQTLDGDFVANVCGEQSATTARQATELVSTTVCDAAEMVESLYLYLECSNWFPLYDQIAYQSICYEGASGLSWLASTQIAIVVCSMVILTYRVVFQDITLSEPTPVVAEANMDNQDVGGEQSENPAETDSNAHEAQTTSLNGSTKDLHLEDDDQVRAEGDDSNNENAPANDRDDDIVASEGVIV